MTTEEVLQSIVEQMETLTEGERYFLRRILESPSGRLTPGSEIASAGFLPSLRQRSVEVSKTAPALNQLRAAPHNLTAREAEVVGYLVNGLSNKETGKLLRISHRTVEVHRAHAMEKLGASSAAHLATIVGRIARH